MPLYSEETNSILSMTGLTVLKDQNLKNRISPTKQLIHHPKHGIITKKQCQLIDKIPTPTKKRVKLPDSINTIPVTKSLRSKIYSINKKQITHRIKNFTNQMSGTKQLYFWTVTFPLNTTDSTAFILLNIWLTRLRKELNLRSYLWITERQQNGTIHFHIVFHQRICVKKANKFMRAAIFNSVKEGLIKFSRKDAKNYNGVDIAKDRKTRRVTNFAKQNKQKSLSTYLTKYVTKNNSTFNHLAWHCSRDYSNLVIGINLSSQDIIRFNLQPAISTEAIFENDFFKFYPWLAQPDRSFLYNIGRINNYIVSLINK